MARLNIEPSLFQDPRFFDLVLKVGDQEKAMGRLVFFWSKAQQSHANGSKLKQTEFRPEWRVLIECGFAEEHEDGIYAKGAEAQFGWLRKRHEAGKTGGINSVKAKASKPKQKQAKPSKLNPLTLPLSLTPSPALADLDASSAASPKALTPGSRVWNAYLEAYESAYRQPPVRNTKTNSLCKQLVERLGEEGAVLVVQFYLTHRNAYYVNKCHPLSACVHDAEGLHTQAKAGYRVSQAEAQQQDQSQANEQVFSAVTEKLRAEGLL